MGVLWSWRNIQLQLSCYETEISLIHYKHHYIFAENFQLNSNCIPVIGLSLLSTEDGLLISARNLYKSSSLNLSPS